MNTIQKNSKGDNPLDYSLNIIDKPYVDINNKLSNLRSNSLVKFRWYRDTYSVILSLKRFSLELFSLGLNYYSAILVFTLKVLHLGLKINLEITSLLLGKGKIRLKYVGNISKLNKIFLPDKSELNNNLRIEDQIRNILYNLEDFYYQFEF